MLSRGVAIGIDEVGRGALAGPVFVAAVCAPPAAIRSGEHLFGALKDSKRLSARKREAWHDFLAARGDVCFAVARVNPRRIERWNISRAANLAAANAYRRVAAAAGIDRCRRRRSAAAGMVASLATVKIPVYLDGGLFLASRSRQQSISPSAKTFPKADENIPAVAAASIIAKVRRDRFMTALAARFPGYGFEIHKGYGTIFHRAAIRKLGPCDMHRLTFLGKSPIM